MSTNKDDFLARLNRIEAAKEAAKGASKPRKQQAVRRKSGSGAGKRVGMMLLGLLVLGGVGFGGYMQRERLAPLMDQAKGYFGELGSLKSKKALDAERAATAPRGVLRKASLYGGLVWSPAVLSNDGGEYLVGEIVEGFIPPTLQDMPKEILSFDPNSACEFRRPKRREKLHSVSLDYGFLKTSVTAFSTQRVAQKLERFLDWNMKYRTQHPMTDYLVSGDFNVVDVFVTDTSAPIYLVLQSAQGATIWNVQAAKGVRIAHVALVSHSHSAVVLPDPKTTFEAVNGADFDKETRSNARKDAGTDCSIHVFRKPKEHWGQWIKANKQDGLYRNQRDTYFSSHRQYDRWFTRVFGESSEANLHGIEAAGHILVGPVPKKKFPYRGLEGATVHMTQADFVFSGAPEERDAKILAMQTKIMDAATDGGFDQMKPELMEMEQ